MFLRLISYQEICRSRNFPLTLEDQFKVNTAICRLNILTMVQKARGGHLGSCLSSLDFLYFLHSGLNQFFLFDHGNPDRDVFVCSKGHCAPALYSVFHCLGFYEEKDILSFRDFGGLSGHPHISNRGIEFNTGSLGMGISKGKGVALAKKMLNRGGRVFVLVGDGEFQEGQNFEALQSAAHAGLDNLTVVMDHNKVQSEWEVEKTLSLRDIESKIQSFGWKVYRSSGHDFSSLRTLFSSGEGKRSGPEFYILDTIKGKGVSFLEHPLAMEGNRGIYPWHAGPLSGDDYERAVEELLQKINGVLRAGGNRDLATVQFPISQSVTGPRGEVLQGPFSEELVELAGKHEKLVVLDCDLAKDCGLTEFRLKFPGRFFQMGIAEQDMVSTSSGLIHQGLLPVLNSFAGFLSSRANEQIYNLMTEMKEGRKAVFVCHYAGLFPSSPGPSHQCVRDIALFSQFPNLNIVGPANGGELKFFLRWAVEESPEPVMIRIPLGEVPEIRTIAPHGRIDWGRGIRLTEGKEFFVFSHGPHILEEVLKASRILNSRGIEMAVFNLPWINRPDGKWLRETLSCAKFVFVVEDHFRVGGMGDHLMRAAIENDFLNFPMKILSVEDYPHGGDKNSVLNFHSLDAGSLAKLMGRFILGEGPEIDFRKRCLLES